MTKHLMIALAVTIFGSCEKPVVDNGPYIKGKLVRNTCIDPVVEILDEEGKTTQSNKTSGDNFPGKNVFTVNNICDFQDYELEEGDVFYFSVIPAPRSTNCAQCHLLVESPAKRLNIRVRQ